MISKVGKVFWRVFSGLFFYFSCFLLVVLLVLQLSSVQTLLAEKLLEVVSEKTDHEIRLNKIKVSWLDHATLQQVLILDAQKDTLIYADQVSANYRIWDLINGRYLNIEDIAASNTHLYLTKHEGALKLNLTQFINSLKSDTLSKRKNRPLRIDHIEVSNLDFKLNDKNKERLKDRVDFSHLDFTIPEIDMGILEIRTDTIAGNILRLRGEDRNSGFEITEFNAIFRITNQSLVIGDLNFNTPSSHLADSLEFYYSGLEDLGYFVDSVSFALRMKESVISQEDFELITGVKELKSDVSLDGEFWGTIGDFNMEDARIGFGDSSFFEGGVSCFGLPDFTKTFILADITKSHLIPEDLEPYIGTLSENLRRMGRIDFKGSFAGFSNDFVARGDFYTDQGSVHSDINIKIPDDPSLMSYNGNIELDGVNIGVFLKNEFIQNINLKGSIEGSGVKPENANLRINATIFQSGLKGYVYDTISVDGRFAKNLFEGRFTINDPNCRLKGEADIDFRSVIDELEADIEIDGIYADRLNLLNTELFAKGHIQLKVVDLDINDFTGELKIDSSLIRLSGRDVLLDSIRFTANRDDSIRVFNYQMPGLSANIFGDFKVTDVINDVPSIISAYTSQIKLTEDTVTIDTGAYYSLKLQAEITDIARYLDSLKIPLEFFGKTKIEGALRKSKNINMSFFTKTDSLHFKKLSIIQPTLELNTSSDINAEDILTNFIFSSSRQRFPGVPPTEHLLLEGVWYDNQIDFTTLIDQPETESDVRLESGITLYNDSLVLKMLPSSIELFKDNWKFNPTNKIVFTNTETRITNLEIFDSSESILVNGVMADTIPTALTISIEDLNMNKANLFTESAISGFLNGNFEVFRNTSNEAFKFDGGFLLKNLKYDNLLIGDVSGSSNWNPTNGSIYTRVDVERENFKSIQIMGNYYPLRDQENLDFEVAFDQANLEIGRPFVEENFSNLGGKASGSLKITGEVDAPSVVGSCNIEGGAITINYLNTFYTFNGRVTFDPKKISFPQFNLVDRKGADARITGTISHNYFKNFSTNILIDAIQFELLNTTASDNELYYGSAYGTGEIKITGPLNDLFIKADIRTDSDTRFFVPISETSDISQQEYIQFVDLSDSTMNVEVEDKYIIKGLTLDFDIEVTPEAYCELIFDIKTGDIIRGRGRGNIKMRLNTDGEFNMFGPLEITEGGYNFTAANIINKEFNVVPGSTITWYGDPYDATMDLEATYLQRASFEELKNPDLQNASELSNKVPILVVLEIDGSLLSPEIGFDIRLQDSGDANQENIPKLAQMRSNEQELRRQVISLLFLKRFSPEQSFSLGGGGGIGGSVSEFLSSQVSYLVSQIDENLEVEVNLADMNKDAFNTFQLRFAYTFLDGRLKVSRGGSFGNPDDNNQNVFNDIVGDWSVEYSLTRDGKLRAKVFRNSTQRLLDQQNTQNHETGVSLRFVHSFNDLKELLTLRREEAIQRREEEALQDEESPEEPNSSSY